MCFSNLWCVLGMYLLLGIGAGFLSGLLGAGGGLIMVPGLVFLFQYESMNHNILMHVAVGTSLAAMIPVALRSLRSHISHHVLFYPIFKSMAPGIIVGVITSSILAHYIRSHYLEMLFGVFVFVMALSLLHERKSQQIKSLPGAVSMLFVGGFIGVQSGLLGVGGSAFSVPFLTYHNVKVHTAVVVSIAIAMTVSILGTIAFMFTGIHATGLPTWSTGYIYWPAWIGLTVGGVFIAPFGVTLSHHISGRKLKVCFALFLFCVSAKMLI